MFLPPDYAMDRLRFKEYAGPAVRSEMRIESCPPIFITTSLMSAEFNVSYTAQLARLNLTEAEITKFQSQLTQVLAYVEKLGKLDLQGVEPTAHTNPIFNVLRADESRQWPNPEAALANAPRSANELFIVPKVIE